jgi:uncharacterized protein (DUF427 family)
MLVVRMVRYKSLAECKNFLRQPLHRRCMIKAMWNNVVIAESDKCIEVEGNQYFPPDSVNKAYFRDSKTKSTCPWKGEAQYYDIVADGKENKDAAWFYPEPKKEAKNIKGYIAFWHGVQIVE